MSITIYFIDWFVQSELKVAGPVRLLLAQGILQAKIMVVFEIAMI